MTKRTPLHPSCLMLALAAALPGLALAAPGAGSAYRTDAQNSHVEDATSKGVDQVNMITCVMSAMRPDALVNQGNYIALVDKNKCDPEARASTENSGSTSAASGAPSYMTAIVNSTRTTNDDPMRVKSWLDLKEQDFNATIFINISATQAPSASNPYGVFRMDYCGKGDLSAPCMMRGYLDGSADGISYFEIEGGGGGGGGTKALRLTTSGTDSGAGKLQMSEGGQDISFSFAYNSTYFLRHLDGGQDQCFTRDASDPETGMSVWRYGLYGAETGDRVTRNSGFPIDYTAPDGKVYHGHMGYWGLWLPPELSVANGATLQRVEYSSGHEPTKTDYTLVKAEGRLMKYTKQTRTLAASDKIRFQTWVGDVTGFYDGAQPNQQYEMYWDDAAGAFKVSGIIQCNNGPCQTSSFDVEKTVQASFFANIGGVRGWSQALGGELFIPLTGGSVVSSNVNVIYRKQDLVYPSEMPASLYCLRDCPTAGSIGSYFADGSSDASPFVASTFNHWGPSDAGAVVAYSTEAGSALLKDGNGAAVTFTNKDALQAHPQYQWGVRTGRLFTTLSAALCDDGSHYCDNKVEQMDTYYQWETGPNQWNQFAALKDGSGAIVAFEAPLQVNYSVPSGAAYGAYAGKSIVLQYGGFGELWGIPGHCVSRITNESVSCDTPDSRYVPAFVIPFDELLGRVDNGGTPLLAKWLDREIRFARKDVSVCSAAGVALHSGLTLPTASGLADPSDSASPIYIGAKPTVTDAPRVIHGDVKY
ncbi:MAG TPA: hypothetical protein VGQ23_20195 [Burkholderiaceae bacterium]|nr:hypothetical protein [Burkholderiaceae bacterium]